jgi:hypothetical protein
MSKFNNLIFSFLILFVPVLTQAQSREAFVTDGGVAYASLFAGNLSLLIAIVIGIVATVYVFRAAGKMGGGLFGLVLNYVGIGMIFIVLGTVTMVVDIWFSALWFNIINTIFFAFGYIFLVVGANKLLKGIMSN